MESPSSDGWGLRLNPHDLDGHSALAHHFFMSTLADIEKAAEKLSSQQKQELMRFLDAQLRAESSGGLPRNLPPAERGVELRRWAASHKPGPGLPDSAIGRDAI
jgi:hypothetical protein